MVPSWAPTFEILSDDYNANITAVCWDKGKQTPYEEQSDGAVIYRRRSELTHRGLVDLYEMSDIVVVSGWQDKGYLRALLKGRKTIPKVAMFDDWWVDPAVLDVTALQERFAALLEIAE